MNTPEPTYRTLEVGEIIPVGAQFRQSRWQDIWIPSRNVGIKVEPLMAGRYRAPANPMSANNHYALLRLLSSIPETRTKDELRAHYANLLDRVTRAEKRVAELEAQQSQTTTPHEHA